MKVNNWIKTQNKIGQSILLWIQTFSIVDTLLKNEKKKDLIN
jgi:hypothetical protein